MGKPEADTGFPKERVAPHPLTGSGRGSHVERVETQGPRQRSKISEMPNKREFRRVLLRSGDLEPLFIRVHPRPSVSNDHAHFHRKIIGVERGTVAIEHGWTRINTDEISSR